MEEDCELLFFDTFSHGTSEDLNLDLVQFPRPVYIHEIRIIPLGARVQADFPGGHRLGATNPSSFELEFFVNDLSRLGACTFKKLGILAYQQNVDIQFPVPTKIPTDGLVLRGWYCTITLAVYGNLTKVCKERSSPPPPPPPPQSNSRNPPVDIRPVQPVEFDCPAVKPVTVSIPDWDRPQLLEPPVEIPPAPVCAHPPLPSVVEAPHYSEPLPVVRAEQCPPSFVEHAPAPVYGVEGPGLNYQKHLTAPLPSGPPQQIVPPPSSYPPYDVPHTKPWPPQDDNYARDSEPYQRQVYGRQDAKMYGGQSMNVHPMWEHPEIPERGHERMIYPHDPAHEHKPLFHREKENEAKERDRDRSWDKERDAHLDYKDEDRQSRNSGRDSKRRDRDHKSRDNNWERQSQDSSDRYSRDRERDRDRSRDSNTRERDKEKDRDRERDKDRSRDRPRERFRDTGRDKGSGSRSRDSSRESHDRQSRPDLNRKSAASPIPSSPPKVHRPRTPQSPLSAEAEKSSAGPRTPKDDEPGEIVEEGGSEEPTADDLFEPLTPDPLPSDQYNLSDGEIQDGNLDDDDVYETIVSDEEIMSDDDERVIEMVELDYDMGDETWNYMSSFNLFQYEVTSLQHFHDPSLTPFEVLREQLKGNCNEMCEEAEKTLQIIKQFADKEHTEKWVEAIENIAVNMPMSGLASITDEAVLNSTVDKLIDWVLEGLDFEAALKQPQPVYKVRHMKAGIRLAAALFLTDVKIIEKLLEKAVPQKLLILYDQPYMALPVKLLILRALDATIFTKQGMQFFIEKCHPYEAKSVILHPKNKEIVPDIKEEKSSEGEVKAKLDNDNEKKVEVLTGYQRLLDLLIPQQSTRAVVAIKALLQKIHLGEILLELRNAVERLVQSLAISEAKAAAESSSTDEHASVDNDGENSPASLVGDAQADIFIKCLNNITNIYKTAKKSVAQPLRYLPARRQFDTSQTSFDPYPGLYRMLRENFLLESLFVLVSSPATSAHSDILTSIRELLLEFLQSQSGILFLLSNPDAVNGIHRALLQAVDDSREESAEDNMTHLLGMQIVCHLQALQFVDILLAYHARGGPKKEMDDADAVSALHHLYTMIFIPVGRMAVVNILSSERNLDALLPFVQMTGEEEYDTKLSKSVCTGYVTELLLLTVHCSEKVTMIEHFAEALINLSAQESTPKLHELSLWMAPTKKIPNYTHEAIPHLMGHIKASSENAASLPQELITALRILQHITIPSNHSTKAKEEDKELKYKYAVIQVFSNDGLSCFLTILQKICDTLLKPSNQSVALVGLQGILVTAIVKPVIVLIQFMLQYLIFCRGTEFKDLTAIPMLLRAHLLMSFVPVTSFSYTLAQQVQSEIVETLLAYTQPYIGSSESEEALSKSLWTQMVQEVLKFLFQSPNTFVTGLSVFSELLPLPLPLQTREPLSADEVSRAVNCRKLWSAHLHSLSTTVQEIIISLSPSSCHPLQQLLRRVCVQLADLATPTALVVVRSVLDALLDSVTLSIKVEDKTDSAPNPIPQWEVKACSTATARILNLMAYLISHAPFKIPLTCVLKGSVKTDEKYGEVLTMILSHLNYESDRPSHIHSQECIVSILQSLCDPDIGFVTLEGGASVNDVLANSLPPKEHISEICGALIQHIGNHRHTFASVLPSLRALVMLTEHDYGFFHLRQALIQYPGALCSLFDRLSGSFSKDSSDCLSTLSTTLEFLRVMVHGFEEPVPARTQVLSTNELCKILQWSKPLHDTASKNHENSTQKDLKSNPLFELERLLTECANDEEALESLLESVNGFVQILSTTKEEKVEREIIEPMLPPAENQSAQFSVRPVYIVGEVDEERLSPSYWLSVPVAEETDQEAEQVPLDLVTLSEKYWTDFDLKDNLEKLCLSTEIDSEAKTKKKSNGLGKRKYHPIVNSTNSESNNKKPFIAPMRGRGFGRGNSHSSRANDPFRSRPPNTSRPPSMHVDDFLALEHHHHHQQPSSSVPLTTKRSTKDTSRGRGRGFDSGRTFGTARGVGGGGGGGNNAGSGGGRFFSPPGPYSRRDANRAGNTRGAARGATNAWGRAGSGTPAKAQNSGIRGFGRGGGSHMEQRQSTQRNRDSYNNNISTGNTSGGRFSRGSHGMGINNQGHWGDTRNKQQDGRFGSTNSSTRGRRDNQSRHTRSFTR